MVPRCAHCDRPYARTASAQRYCSRLCSQRAARARRGSRAPTVCAGCGGPIAVPPGNGGVRRYCDEACRERTRLVRARELHRQKRASGWVKPRGRSRAREKAWPPLPPPLPLTPLLPARPFWGGVGAGVEAERPATGRVRALVVMHVPLAEQNRMRAYEGLRGREP